jgi:Secretion system C-terminal sorting domain
LMRTGDIPDNDLVIHFVVVEDLFFDGRNTISNHKQVMRKMLPTPSGKSFSINLNETINIGQSIDIEANWDADSLSVVVFVQSSGLKTVYQSETISYNDLVVSNDDNANQIPEEFILEQNYPNPFNPSSTIKFSIPTSEFVTLEVFDILGNEVAALVKENKLSGTYEVLFSAARLSSGVYFYQLKAGEFLQTKKMILMK